MPENAPSRLRCRFWNWLLLHPQSQHHWHQRHGTLGTGAAPLPTNSGTSGLGALVQSPLQKPPSLQMGMSRGKVPIPRTACHLLLQILWQMIWPPPHWKTSNPVGSSLKEWYTPFLVYNPDKRLQTQLTTSPTLWH